MKGIIFLALLASPTALASTPEVIITHTDSYNGYATIAGHLEEDPGKAVGVSVENGGIRYSTVSDSEGKWAIVIRHRAYTVDVYSWDLTSPDDRSKISKNNIKMIIDINHLTI